MEKEILLEESLKRFNSILRYNYYLNESEKPLKDGVEINQYDAEGRKQGYWEEYVEDLTVWDEPETEFLFKGSYKDGKKDGYWEMYYPGDSQIMEKGNYKDGKKIGKWRHYADDGGDYTEFDYDKKSDKKSDLKKMTGLLKMAIDRSNK